MRAVSLNMVLVGALTLLVLLSLCIGVYPVSMLHVARSLVEPLWPQAWGAPPGDAERIVVTVVRLPRVALATFAGAALGLAGAVLQGLLRNPLVGPDIVGVSGGAACGGVIAITLGLAAPGLIVCALAGGIAAVVLAAGLARLAPGGALAIVLSGVIVGSFCSALLTLLEFLADPTSSLPEIVYWLLGSFADADRQAVTVMGGALAVAGSGLLLLRWRINILSLGDDEAAALGLRVGPLRWLLVVLVAVLVAAQVSVSGIVGWVGLIVPHLARMLVGPDHRRLLPVSAIIGAMFVLLADDLARAWPTQELPVGLLTSVVGTPVFALLLWRTRARGWRRG